MWISPLIGVRLLDVFDDLADFERHDCNGTDGYILRGGAMTQGLVQGVQSNVLVGTNKNWAKSVTLTTETRKEQP